MFKYLEKNPNYPTWYRGFNYHSLILHNFLLANNLVSDVMLNNSTNCFTYFCHKRSVYTWIDHVLCSDFDASSITNCSILEYVADNVSDHLPMCTEILIPQMDKQSTATSSSRSSFHGGNGFDIHSPARLITTAMICTDLFWIKT
jgi:hypothetical protein